MYFLTKKFSFDAAHKLEGYSGKCGMLHGHLYSCEFTVCGNHLTLKGKDKNIPMLMDFKDMKQLTESIIEFHDHTYLNDTMQCSAPTAEFMASLFYKHINTYITSLYKNVFLYSVKVWETPDSCAEYRGNDSDEFLVDQIKGYINGG